MTAAHPWRALREQPAVSIGYRDLGEHAGMYLADLDVILLHTKLLQVERRCTLAHELAHRRLGHTACYDRKSARLQEVEAEVVAARWLIPMEAYIRARLWSPHACEQAEELWVDVPMLHARGDGFTLEERSCIEQRLRARDGAA